MPGLAISIALYVVFAVLLVIQPDVGQTEELAGLEGGAVDFDVNFHVPSR